MSGQLVYTISVGVLQRMARKWQIVLQWTLRRSFFNVGAAVLVIFAAALMTYQGFHTSFGTASPRPIEVTSTGPIIVVAPDETKDDGAVLGASAPSQGQDTLVTSNVLRPEQPVGATVPGSPTLPSGAGDASTGGVRPAMPPVVVPAAPIFEAVCNPAKPLDYVIDKVESTIQTLVPPVRSVVPACLH